MLGAYNSKTYQPLMEYVIATNGIPKVQFIGPPAQTYYNWVSGFYQIRPQGGLQLIHTNVVNLIETASVNRKISLQNYGSGGTILPHGDLWTAPEETSSRYDLPVTLAESAEAEDGAYYAEGLSCGYVRVPKVKEGWEKITVLMDIVPQGTETLATLKAGFEKAGFAVADAEGDYNVAVEIPGSLLTVWSRDEKILFDFKDYPDSDTVRLDNPNVRALVKRIKVEKPAKGLMLILR